MLTYVERRAMLLLLVVLSPEQCFSWMTRPPYGEGLSSSRRITNQHGVVSQRGPFFLGMSSSASSSTEDSKESSLFDGKEQVDFDSLIDMDVVIYKSKKDNNEEDSRLLLGALQEDGVLSPLSVWTTEPAFGDSIEFLVDEEDRFSLDPENVNLLYRLDQDELSYGSRQCHRGVGNPHGEESELLYYVEQEVLDKYGIELQIKPDLEILW